MDQNIKLTKAVASSETLKEAARIELGMEDIPECRELQGFYYNFRRSSRT